MNFLHIPATRNSLRPDGSARWPITTADVPSLPTIHARHAVQQAARDMRRRVAATREGV